MVVWGTARRENPAWQNFRLEADVIGVCMPEANRLQLGMVPKGRTSRWSSSLVKSLGPFLDEKVGFLNYPLSFDAGPDGRIYVLDAGNTRVLSFDADHNFITQWGRPGNNAGEFHFGYGLKRMKGLDFTGSICVDDEGYIYVADVFNQRIQKFAP